MLALRSTPPSARPVLDRSGPGFFHACVATPICHFTRTYSRMHGLRARERTPPRAKTHPFAPRSRKRKEVIGTAKTSQDSPQSRPWRCELAARGRLVYVVRIGKVENGNPGSIESRGIISTDRSAWHPRCRLSNGTEFSESYAVAAPGLSAAVSSYAAQDGFQELCH